MYLLFLFFKQKTAYEMRISDWSSDVCSSDLCSCSGSRAPRRPRARAGTWLPSAARASWRALAVLEHVARGGGIRALGVGELVVDVAVDRRVDVRGVRRLHGRVLGRRLRIARSHDMVDRARWVDPGMRERGLDQADRLAAHLAQVAVVLVDPAEELQVDAGRRVLDHGPRGRRVLQHAVAVRVGLPRQRLRLADRMRGIDADRETGRA